ncbi:MAG: FimB/Mfa2 family fimbrial subunit [Alistipes sp.]|nr:FimB/Mfa2 family fimbrial subunit [Alistipes sp.]
MKNLLYKILILSITLSVASCSVKEDMDDCPPAGLNRITIEFECIRIYDTGDREIVFDKVTDELELLFYDKQGSLINDLRYDAARLAENEWRVYVEQEAANAGHYTLLALVNYDNEHYTFTGKEKLETLLAGLKYGPSRSETSGMDEIDFPLTDTYYGRYDLALDYDSNTRSHKVMLSKNTNMINLTVICQDEEDFRSITSFETRISGNNTLYDWENSAVEAQAVSYVPYASSYNDEGRWYTDRNKTMRLWHTSDLNLEIEITAAGLVHHQTQNIAEWLVKDDRYDTDEKLEHYDEFDIEITYAKGFVIISVMINGWYIINIGEPL